MPPQTLTVVEKHKLFTANAHTLLQKPTITVTYHPSVGNLPMFLGRNISQLA